jgi:hypothetical protein
VAPVQAPPQGQPQAPQQAHVNPIVTELVNIHGTIGRNSCRDSIARYKGDPKAFRLWIKQLEKAVGVRALDIDETVALAYESADGPPSDFIGRYVKVHRPTHWVDLKPELQAHFAEVTDPQHALYVLRTTTQGKESAHVFGERVIELAEDAWPGQDIDAPLIQAQLVDIFIDGLKEKLIARKVLRAATGTLLGAIQAATREQDWTRRYELRGLGGVGTGTVNRNPRTPRMSPPAPQVRREEPMEVDRFRGRCNHCNKYGHKAIDCRARRVQVVSGPDSGPNRQGQARPGPRLRRCWVCGSPDHLMRDCPQRQGDAWRQGQGPSAPPPEGWSASN